MTAARDGRASYRVTVASIEACNCQHWCNCQVLGFPTEGHCEFIIAYEVKEGHVAQVPLTGLRAVLAATYPSAIHEGNGHLVLFIDEAVTDEQAVAFATMLSGQLGGMPWEALAGTIGRFEGPIRTPIEITTAGEQSIARIPGFMELRLTPVRDACGHPKEVHIVYPTGGFFSKDVTVATTDVMRAQHDHFQIEWPGRYAATSEVTWTNE